MTVNHWHDIIDAAQIVIVIVDPGEETAKGVQELYGRIRQIHDKMGYSHPLGFRGFEGNWVRVSWTFCSGFLVLRNIRRKWFIRYSGCNFAYEISTIFTCDSDKVGNLSMIE